MKGIITSIILCSILLYPNVKEDRNIPNIENKYGLTSDELEIFEDINNERQKNNLQNLKIDYELENVARLKAKEIVDNNYFEHNSPTYGKIDEMLLDFGIKFESVSENICGNASNKKALNELLNSSDHRNNILSKDYNYTGIGVVNSTKYGKVYVQIFIKRVS